ncbi:MAG: AAA family ATPase [Myxococcales bacterium]|nr:AAA family ATPase [Myxococcales bacterium]
MTSLHVEGFKAIGDATLHWHPRVNIITGPNNSGKTTVLEALALWVESFDRISYQAAKAVKKNGLRQGDWGLGRTNVHHSDVVSVRSPGFDDLFYRSGDSCTLTATFTDDADEFSVPLHIRKARGGHYEFDCKAALNVLNPRLNAVCTKWPHPFRVIFASPVAAVLSREEFRTPGKVNDMIRQRRSAGVLRNRIHRLYSTSSTNFERFTTDVSHVLAGDAGDVQIEVHGDPNTGVHAIVFARSNPRDQMRDISLLGSGSLQVIEVLLNLYLDPTDLDLVLLDEPDSHIHRDIQRRLLEVIEDKAEYAQVFATTHNESLLRNVGWDRVFHLTPAPADSPKHFHPVASEQLMVAGRKQGLIASPLRSVLSSIGAETALDFLNALESKHFLMVEGSGDAVLLDRLFEISRMKGPRDSAMYWSLNGIDGGLRSLASLKPVLSHIRNDRSLWDKAKLILDRDLLTFDQAQQVSAALAKKLGLQAHFWEARTVEATLLSGGPSGALAHALFRACETDFSGVPDRGLAERACEEAWTALGTRLTDKWNADLNLEALHGTLFQRLDTLDQSIGGSIRGGIGKAQDLVLKYHQNAIKSGEYWQSADKQDVASFCSHTFTVMGVPADQAEAWSKGPNWFQSVCAQIRSANDFPALQTMRGNLK